MIIKVGTEYLDFNGDIETEKQANLLEDISEVNGDFSYSFEVDDTPENRAKLNVVNINTTANFSQKVDCVLLSDSGEDLHYGYIRVESIAGGKISCSFFGGNNNWFVLTDQPIRDYNFKRLEKDFTFANVIDSHSVYNGIVWPLVDRGTLYQRETPTLFDNDWQPFVYVKDVVRTVLGQEGVKLEGDILKDPVYNSMITANNGLSGVQMQIDSVSVYAYKDVNQTINSTSYTDVPFQVTSDPYFEGTDNNWTSPEYTVTKDFITLDVELALILSTPGGGLSQMTIKLTVDGTTEFVKSINIGGSTVYNKIITLDNIYSGSVIKLEAKLTAGSINNTRISVGSTIKFNPIKLRKVYVSQLLPDQNASEYIASMFSRLNLFVSYDGKSRTINTKFLDNIVKETPIDLSQFVDTIEQDNSTIIDDYAKSNTIIYSEGSDEFLEKYNSLNAVPYGAGNIEVDNDFIEEQSDLMELEEIPSFQIPISWLGFTLPLLVFNEFETTDTSDNFSGVRDSSGYAGFETTFPTPINEGDLVRVSSSSNAEYVNLIGFVTDITLDVATDVITTDIPYVGNGTGTLEVITVEDSTNDDQVILLNVPSTNLSNFTDTPSINWYRAGDNTLTSVALAYFWLPQVNRPINSIGKALYFDKVNDPQAYQIGLIDAYFRSAERILNNPVMITAIMYLPTSIYRSIDFLRPVRIETKEFTSNFLVNRIIGYKGQEFPCEVELIKIS